MFCFALNVRDAGTRGFLGIDRLVREARASLCVVAQVNARQVHGLLFERLHQTDRIVQLIGVSIEGHMQRLQEARVGVA